MPTSIVGMPVLLRVPPPGLASALSILLAISACGGPIAVEPDAGPADAMPDAIVDAPPSDGAVPTMAELPACAIVSDADGVFVEDAAHLVVHGSDGQPICRNTPAVHGARIAVPPGGAITIVRQSVRGLLTILHPQPGDVIDLVPAPRGMYSVRLDVAPLAGATDYRLYCPGASGDGTNPDTLSVPGTCLGTDNLIHGLVVAFDPSHAVVGYGAVALAPIGVTFTSGQGPPVSSFVWQTATVPLTVTVANAPAGLGTTWICATVAIEGVLTAWPGCVSAGTTVQMPAIGDALVVQVRLRAYESDTWLETRRYPIGTQAITFDVTADALPQVITTGFGGTTARPSVAWTTSRPIDRGSELVATATWVSGQSPFENRALWQVVAPIDTPSPLLFPQLPLDLQPLGTREEPELFLWDADGAPYAELRREPFRPYAWPQFVLPAPTPSRPQPDHWGLSVRGDFD